MPYSHIKSDIHNRFLEVNHFLNHIKSVEDSYVAPSLPSIEYKILKGLFYVHLYACIEFSVNKIVVHTLSSIKTKNIPYSHLENRFHTITLYPQLQSVRDCNSKYFLDKSADVFLMVESMDIAQFEETNILKYIQNIWGKTFNQLTKTIGLSHFPIAPRSVSVMDEIVENRNKVAHGRDSCESVGSAPKFADLKSKYDTAYEVINQYIEHFENFYKSKTYIRMVERGRY